jgi:signal peptidase II
MKKDIKKKKALVIFLIILAVVILDQLMKYLVVKRIEPGGQISLINNFLYLTHVHNFGAAFSLFQGAAGLIIWFSVIVIGIILYFYDKLPDLKYAQASASLLLGGIIGNLIDRIRLGYVIDFIDFRFWPAFNVADIAITAGVIGLIIYFIKKR